MSASEVSFEELPIPLVQHVLDDLIDRGADFPVVLVDGEIACADGVDVAKVLEFLDARE